MQNLSDHGLWWNGKDLRTLWKMHGAGMPLAYIAQSLGRTPSATQSRLRMLKINDLWKNGNDDDTLATYNKRTTHG